MVPLLKVLDTDFCQGYFFFRLIGSHSQQAVSGGIPLGWMWHYNPPFFHYVVSAWLNLSIFQLKQRGFFGALKEAVF
jgi:hypothetical protein